MSRFFPLLLVVVAAACGGHRTASPVAPASSAAGAHARTADRAATSATGSSVTPEQALVLPPAPAMDTLVPQEELAAELRLAADSAADEAVLEALDDARPADDDSEEALPGHGGHLGHRRRHLSTTTIGCSTTWISSRARAASGWASGSPACRATRR